MKQRIKKVGDAIRLPADANAGLPAQRAKVVSIDRELGVAMVRVIAADRTEDDRDGLTEVEIDRTGRVLLSGETAGMSFDIHEEEGRP